MPGLHLFETKAGGKGRVAIVTANPTLPLFKKNRLDAGAICLEIEGGLLLDLGCGYEKIGQQDEEDQVKKRGRLGKSAIGFAMADCREPALDFIGPYQR
jgi:hypothetical protein